jgi:hypothetical protein
MRRVGVVGTALIGVWILASAPSLLVYPALMLGSFISGASVSRFSVAALVVDCVPFVLGVLAGVWLVVNRVRVANTLLDDSSLDQTGEPLAWLQPGIVLLGLYFAVVATTGASGSIVSAVSSAAQQRGVSAGIAQLIVRQQLAALVPALLVRLFQLGIGVVFIVKSAAVASWVTRGVHADA